MKFLLFLENYSGFFCSFLPFYLHLRCDVDWFSLEGYSHLLGYETILFLSLARNFVSHSRSFVALSSYFIPLSHLFVLYLIPFTMMRALFFGFALTLGITELPAQSTFTESYDTPAFVQSKYHSLSTAVAYPAKATVDFRIGNNKSIQREDQKARFVTLVDPDSVYDATYKVYAAEFSDLRVEYMTYNQADRLSLTLNGKTYTANCIDGGSDVFLKNLAHSYKTTPTGEELRLKVAKDFPLTAKDKSKLWLRANSEFVFTVNDQAAILETHPDFSQAYSRIAPFVSTEQKEKALFLYGFYMAYMNGTMYDASNNICDALIKSCAPKYFKPFVVERKWDYDIFLDTQDCVEAYMNSLFISPMPDDYFEVRLRWPAVEDNRQQTISQETRIRVHVVQSKGSYQIDNVISMNE